CKIDVELNVKNCPARKELLCGSAIGSRSNGNISDRTFGLPTYQEFKKADQDGAGEVLVGLGGWHNASGALYGDGGIWTSSVAADPKYAGAWTFVGEFAKFGENPLYFDWQPANGVRCVGHQ